MSLIVKAGKAGKRVLKKFLPEEKHHVSYTRRIERVQTGERVVAMTFDDGPMDLPSSPDKFDGRSLTDILLDTLAEYDAKGTFDVVGDTSENYPDVAGKTGQADWGGVKYDHYPDINQDDRGGVVHNPRLVRRILDEGHQITNHSYRHVLFGKKPFVYGKRDHFHGLDEVVADLSRLHSLMQKTYGYTMTMSRPPHYVDRIEGGFSSYDAYDQMGYLYMAASFDGAGWLPLHHGSAQESLQAEAEAMVAPMRHLLAQDPDALAGQIIFQKDGYKFVSDRTELLAGPAAKNAGHRLLRQPPALGRPHDLGRAGHAPGPQGREHPAPHPAHPGERHRPARQLGGDGLVRRAGHFEIRHGPGRGRDQFAQRVLRFLHDLHPPGGVRDLPGITAASRRTTSS